jgi:hypothetical protein
METDINNPECLSDERGPGANGISAGAAKLTTKYGGKMANWNLHRFLSGNRISLPMKHQNGNTLNRLVRLTAKIELSDNSGQLI